MKEMSKIFPNNTVIPVNEWILKGMTIIHQDQVGYIADKSLEEEYLELLKDDYWQGGSR